MRVLVTGANGYIGLRLIPSLLDAGHDVVALVRNSRRFPADDFEDWGGQLSVLEGDFLNPDSLPKSDCVGSLDASYYLIHSMGEGAGFSEHEAFCAESFVAWLDSVGCGQIVYLGGITPQNEGLSEHLSSRKKVGEILAGADCPLTTLNASIIVGSGSASFEMIRDLVEKLPVMVTPKWARTRCQPIAIRNVIAYLLGVIQPECRVDVINQSMDIGGPQVLTYQEMLTGYARVRGLHRLVLPVPFLSPNLSAHWLYFMTATSFPLAKALVGSLHLETRCREGKMASIVPQDLLNYDEAIELALSRVAQNRVPSVWYDAISSGQFDPRHIRNVQVPAHGVLIDARTVPLVASRDRVIDSVWSLGGDRGWPSMDWAWRLRGLMDKSVGGSGMRRGRRDQHDLRIGDALDFWRVVVADRENGRLVLFAEMKLPGEAWLEFTVGETTLTQRAVFRPRGVLGRLYWASTYPFHLIIFPKMVASLACGE